MTATRTGRTIATGLLAAVLAGCSGGPAASTGATASAVPASVPASQAATPGPTAAAAATAAASAPPSATPLRLLGGLPASPLAPPVAARLQAVLDQAVKGGAPAIMAAVITADGTWTGASGVVGPSGKPATKDDVFAIASATKPVVAALLLRLAELGKIDLDAPLSSFGLDDDLTNGATVRQALEMRGGIGDTDPAVLAKVDADCSHAWTRDEVLAAFPKPVTTAGGRWAYSNPGYKLAGYAAETATGGSLADAVRTYVLDPAGVDRLVFQGEGAKTPTPWAVPIDGHAGAIAAADYGKGGALPCLSDATFSSAGAGMASDASSLARWAWALFAGKIIDERSLATMTETSGDQYGLGIWQFDDFRPNLAYGHAGNKPGYAPIFVVFPDRQVVIALAITEQEADPFAPVGKLLAALQ